MLKKNKNKPSKILSLEINDENIVAVEVEKSNDVAKINAGFRVDAPVFTDLDSTVNLLKQNIKTSSIKSRDVIVTSGMQYFKLFPVSIPVSIPPQEISQILAQEGGVNLQSDSLSFIPLNNTQRTDSDGVARYDVLGISISKTFIQTIVDLMSRCGLSLQLLAPSFSALAPFIDPNISSALTSTLWISKLRSEMIVWSGTEPIYENLVLTSNINEQVKETVNYIETQIPGANVSSIYACGPYVYDVDLLQLPYNFKSFSLTQNVLDGGKVLQKLSLGESVISIGSAISFLGLTPISIPNLLVEPASSSESPKTFDSQSNLFKKKSVPSVFNKFGPDFAGTLKFGAFLLFLTVLLTSFIYVKLMPTVKSDSSFFSIKLNSSQSRLNQALQHQRKNQIYKTKINYLSSLIDRRTPWSLIFKEIATYTPKHLWVDRLEVRNKKINILGRSIDVDSVANFSINLNYTSKHLANAQIVTLKKYQEEGVDFIEFQITADVVSDPSKKKFDIEVEESEEEVTPPKA